MAYGEFALIDRIRRRAGHAKTLSLGIGDDCSAQTLPAGHRLLTSTDLLLENVHFRLAWTDLYSLGIKSVAVNVSDIAAMGGTPLSIHLGVGLPESLSPAQIDLFLDGVFAALATYDLVLAGGDTCRSKGPLMIAVTVQGTCPVDAAILRSGAQAGDDLWVSGSLGDSALGLRLLNGGQPVSEFFAQRHHRPIARVNLGQQLSKRRLATAMLDLSDGLLGDLMHLLDASQVGAQVALAELPLSAEFAAAVQPDPQLIDLALCGGEDYELLFSAPRQKRTTLVELSGRLSLRLTRIGQITVESGLRIYQADQTIYQPQMAAYDHFSA